MKNFLLPILATSLSFSAANAQVKKVILEDFTGTWCGWCPEGTVIVDNLLAAYPTTFIPVASHNGDALEIPDGAAVDVGLNVTSYPNGAVDRNKFPSQAKIPMSRSAWASSYATRAAMTAIVSVSFSDVKITGTTYSAKVNVKFTTAPNSGVPLKMNVYLTEDSIAATGSYAQSNFSSAVQSGASPLVGWYHNATLRQALGGAWGYTGVIPATPVVGTTYSKDISFTIPTGWDAKHINVIAFVAYDGTAASFQKEVLNAEQFPLKQWAKAASISENNSIEDLGMSVSPNPAKNNSFIKTTFTLKQDAKVTMQVLNSLGQVVSLPYSSFEIAGSHTIQWNAQEYSSAIAPGTYFIKVSTDKGGYSVSKLIIQ
jgi:hypothetical protein